MVTISSFTNLKKKIIYIKIETLTFRFVKASLHNIHLIDDLMRLIMQL